jgi:predicted lysophospholipase L1 biosynthesis ABC-type transport system permease subunit
MQATRRRVSDCWVALNLPVVRIDAAGAIGGRMRVGLFITNRQVLATDMVSALDEQLAMVRPCA